MIDLETTGSSSKEYDICQIGGVFLDRKFNVLGTFLSDVKPISNIRQAEAMQVHKISEERLKIAPSLGDVLINFEKECLKWYGSFKEMFLGCWGGFFDIPFLRMKYEQNDFAWPFGYKYLCLKSFAIGLLLKKFGKVEMDGLASVARMLNIAVDEKKLHNGLEDALLTVKIMQELLK